MVSKDKNEPTRFWLWLWHLTLALIVGFSLVAISSETDTQEWLLSSDISCVSTNDFDLPFRKTEPCKRSHSYNPTSKDMGLHVHASKIPREG